MSKKKNNTGCTVSVDRYIAEIQELVNEGYMNEEQQAVLLTEYLAEQGIYI